MAKGREGRKRENFFKRVLRAHRTRLAEYKKRKPRSDSFYKKRYEKAAKEVKRLFGAPPYTKGSDLAKEAVVALENFIMSRNRLKYGNLNLLATPYGLFDCLRNKCSIPGWPNDWLGCDKYVVREYCRQAAIQLIEAFHEANPEWPLVPYDVAGHMTGPFPHVSHRASAGTHDRVVYLSFVWAEEE